MQTALTIAGFDPSGGAGIQADLKTFHAHGVYGLSAVTAVTVQNTYKVYNVYEIKPQIVYDQILCLFEDVKINAVKIGMVSNTEQINAVADALLKVDTPYVVLDPVMISTSGYRLLKPGAQTALVKRLFPISEVVTPNIYEAETFTGKEINNIEEMKGAALKIYKMGVKSVVIKGGHILDEFAADIIYDGRQYKKIQKKSVVKGNIHGTGCAFSSAIAANLANGKSLTEAVTSAKAYITRAICHSLSFGKGQNLVDHFENI